MQKREVQNFQKTVWDFYAKNRRDLPWRVFEGGRGAKPRAQKGKRKVSPYEILVSEFMLQQTQVDRVVPKFLAFLERFPTMHDLAISSQKDLLLMWSGLGYNRRAIYLQRSVQAIVGDYKGRIPKDPTILKTLPGIGDYMAHILPVFIYNQPEVLIETNIRTVFLHHFFEGKDAVSDAEIFEKIKETLPIEEAHDWYYALMDYGSYLKKEKKIKNTQSVHYTKQKPFKGSLRYVRGTLLKKLVIDKVLKADVYNLFPTYSAKDVEKVCENLLREGLMKETKKYFFI
jgi:A/G-specific adenine glycosylase